MSLAPPASIMHATASTRHARQQVKEAGFQTMLADTGHPAGQTVSPPSATETAAIGQAKDMTPPITKASTLQTVTGRNTSPARTPKSSDATPTTKGSDVAATPQTDEKKTHKSSESKDGITPPAALSVTPDMPVITTKPSTDNDTHASVAPPPSINEASTIKGTSTQGEVGPQGSSDLSTLAQIGQKNDAPTAQTDQTNQTAPAQSGHDSSSKPAQTLIPAMTERNDQPTLPAAAQSSAQTVAPGSLTGASSKTAAPPHKPTPSVSTAATGASGASATFASYALKIDAIPKTSVAPSTDTDLKKTTGSVSALQSLEATGSQIQTNIVTSADQPARADALNHQPAINLAPAALSATISALHQSGQTTVLLRLDPPELGHLSVQVKMDAQGAVNLLFIPSTAEAAQALHSSLNQLGNALVQSGLTLGQAEVGGQFSQSGRQNNSQGFYMPQRQTASSRADGLSSVTAQISGLSAYA